MHKQIAYLQTLLIPKQKFPHEHQAIKQVEKMGLNSHYKTRPDSRGNFFRFRQKPIAEEASYHSQKLKNGSVLVFDNTRKNFNENLMGRKDKITGEQHGIWKKEYQINN